jgi:hypothetical protein
MPDKVPLGKPLQLTEKELEELAKVTEKDIEKAKKFWRKNAPPEFKNLLDAEEVKE